MTWYLICLGLGVVGGLFARPFIDQAIAWTKGEQKKVGVVVSLVKDGAKKL